MQDTLENHQSTISMGGRTISNLRFADDIDLLDGPGSVSKALSVSLENVLYHMVWK